MSKVINKLGIRTDVRPDAFSKYLDFRNAVTIGDVFRRIPIEEIDKWLKPKWNECTRSKKKVKETPKDIGESDLKDKELSSGTEHGSDK